MISYDDLMRNRNTSHPLKHLRILEIFASP